jgi:hypothetical protein
MRNFFLAALFAGISSPAFAGTVYYIDLINTATTSIVSFEAVLTGSDRYHSVLLGNTPLRGGGASATIAIRKGEDGCLRDLRVGFADGRVLTHRDFNICKYRSYLTDHSLHGQNPLAQVTQPQTSTP